jgi:hypothetical protein
MIMFFTMCDRYYTEIPGYIRETYLETLEVETFAPDKPGNINIRCSSFLKNFSIGAEYRSIHMRFEWIACMSASSYNSIHYDIFTILIYIRP